MMRSDFLDAERWAELARARNVRLPLWRMRCTRGQMTKWLRKLGVPLSQYLEWSGERNLGDFVTHDPDWPLRAWVGLLL